MYVYDDTPKGLLKFLHQTPLNIMVHTFNTVMDFLAALKTAKLFIFCEQKTKSKSVSLNMIIT